MNRDDIIRMMREALNHKVDFNVWTISTPHLERFAALVAAAEREAILQMSADNWYKTQWAYDDAIRARGQA